MDAQTETDSEKSTITTITVKKPGTIPMPVFILTLVVFVILLGGLGAMYLFSPVMQNNLFNTSNNQLQQPTVTVNPTSVNVATVSITPTLIPTATATTTPVNMPKAAELVNLPAIGGVYFIPLDNTALKIKYSIPGIMIDKQNGTYTYIGNHYAPQSDVENDVIRFTIYDKVYTDFVDTKATKTINGKVFNVFQANTYEIQSCGTLYTTKNSLGNTVGFTLCSDRRYLTDDSTGDTAAQAAAEKIDYQTMVDKILNSIVVY